MPTAPGWEFGAVYQAAREVGGDFYDFLGAQGRHGSLDVVIGDVTGKGLLAAAHTAMARNFLRAYAFECGDPAFVLEKLDA